LKLITIFNKNTRNIKKKLKKQKHTKHNINTQKNTKTKEIYQKYFVDVMGSLHSLVLEHLCATHLKTLHP